MIATTIAYAFALQALVTFWVAALAPAEASFDPLSYTCLTINPDGTPVKRPADHGLACHCPSACVDSHCCGTGPLAAAQPYAAPSRDSAVLGAGIAADALPASVAANANLARGPPVSG